MSARVVCECRNSVLRDSNFIEVVSWTVVMRRARALMVAWRWIIAGSSRILSIRGFVVFGRDDMTVLGRTGGRVIGVGDGNVLGLVVCWSDDVGVE